ncbi:MAG TPA: hypothetical protein VH187_07950 [Scandinavium sp.]|jgi:hypothetical protein|uniref:hypothetical protein n=1 Tax=Scandinavium sp. TaxID=2830653 RepID=UPI002E368E12|nr:hypothetical protein [Scandinavium sp.]HEX4501077.1 hypothetical protein [Scandinavium sp.]
MRFPHYEGQLHDANQPYEPDFDKLCQQAMDEWDNLLETTLAQWHERIARGEQ